MCRLSVRGSAELSDQKGCGRTDSLTSRTPIKTLLKMHAPNRTHGILTP